MRPANRVTASGSSAASWRASASRDSAPTGVLSSWLTLATKSRRTASTRRCSVWSSASYLERLGDHSVDIGEQVAFIVTGEVKELVPSKAVRAGVEDS